VNPASAFRALRPGAWRGRTSQPDPAFPQLPGIIFENPDSDCSPCPPLRTSDFFFREYGCVSLCNVATHLLSKTGHRLLTNPPRTLRPPNWLALVWRSLAGFDQSVRHHNVRGPIDFPLSDSYRSEPVLWNSAKRQSWPVTSRPVSRRRTTDSQCSNAVALKAVRSRDRPCRAQSRRRGCRRDRRAAGAASRARGSARRAPRTGR
jgi:hypothetical protein